MLTRGEETQATEKVALAEQLIQKLGKPDASREWNATALDYQLKDGNIFTITITDGEKIWAGLKIDLKKNIGKRVTLSGVYSGPGKAANYIHTRDSQAVYINLEKQGGEFPDDLQFGDRIVLVGTLEFYPGQDSGTPFATSSPACFHIDDAAIKRDVPLKQ